VTADVTATHATQTLDEEVEGQLIFVVWLAQWSDQKEIQLLRGSRT
jgi:hypothetical protein